ncbi:MAG: sodium:proton exchanger [Tenericutes bacterium GWC2_34_14]|nr:MAG: sodium:proton exchanger [Tenericutes bacterium GWA2_35_7]OHE28962.1 MAG: sodium:proton exchanger [Tenericutes bacterium GWC2_34_14]OHE33827.1 MAG: sodium:proton exchanger [Tenericutes bacterium GWE2_34_108]OHE36562.1 MAG: sodium:proton exchanger [Tenericutes bacterium GWF1_35_14]OHE37862.1 MAG: sodium:proton exchanger [Tenericutes bacterium GWF2_35_184]OHE45316.1 MAG: sodium:proton exchanger [Tenericutes bacterium RIFOXYA2_FULL_36_32]OHE45912.1 MAG: sodium:proton exchanger [Tenericute
MNVILKLSLILVVGFIFGKVAKALKLPSVSGYLIAGLFLGPSLFDFVTKEEAESFEIISELTLSFIAFGIGSEFMLKDIIAMGKKIAIITLAEVVGAIVVVFSMMFFVFDFPLAFSLVIASMSAATAPAATIMVIRQYKAYGPVTKTILPVVALDDVFGIMAFGIAISIAKILVSGQDVSVLTIVGLPLLEIFGSLLLGLALGVVLSFLTKKIDPKDELQIKTVFFVGLAAGISMWLGLSPLLTNIMMGATLANLRKYANRSFSAVNDFVPIFYVLFFTLAGASLDIAILKSVGLAGLGYIVARAGGKILGAFIGAKSVNAEPQVQKWLGIALLPQGGISIGLSVIVMQQLPQYAVELTTIIMASVLVYETFGPIFAKISISKAGEINALPEIEDLLEPNSSGH